MLKNFIFLLTIFSFWFIIPQALAQECAGGNGMCSTAGECSSRGGVGTADAVCSDVCCIGGTPGGPPPASRCDFSGTCDSGETCSSCPSDCGVCTSGSCAGSCRRAVDGCTAPEVPDNTGTCSGSQVCCKVPDTGGPGANACTVVPGARCATISAGCSTDETPASRGGCSTGQMCCDRVGGTTPPSGTPPSGTPPSGTPPNVQIIENPLVLQNPLKFNNVNDLLTTIIAAFQGFIVILSLIFIIIGALFYITSAGNESRMETGKKAILASLIGLAIGIAAPAFLREIGGMLGWTTPTLPTGVGSSLTLVQILTNILNFLLTIIGILAVIMLIIGGFMYLTAAGDEDRIDTGKKIVKYSVIGILVALISLVLLRQIAVLFT